MAADRLIGYREDSPIRFTDLKTMTFAMVPSVPMVEANCIFSVNALPPKEKEIVSTCARRLAMVIQQRSAARRESKASVERLIIWGRSEARSMLGPMEEHYKDQQFPIWEGILRSTWPSRAICMQ